MPAYRVANLPEQLFDEEELRRLRSGVAAPAAAAPVVDQATQGPAAVGDNDTLLEILYALGSIVAPPVGIYAGRKLATKQRTKQETEEKRRFDVGSEQWQRAMQFQEQQEGLGGAPTGAVPGWMSVGEARGRTAMAAEDQAAAAVDKAAAGAQLKLEAEIVPIFRKLAERDPAAALKLYGELKQSANPFAALIGTTIGPRIEQILRESNANLGGKGAGAGKPAAAAPAAMPKTADDAKKMGWTYKKVGDKAGYVSPDGQLVLPVK